MISRVIRGNENYPDYSKFEPIDYDSSPYQKMRSERIGIKSKLFINPIPEYKEKIAPRCPAGCSFLAERRMILISENNHSYYFCTSCGLKEEKK